MDRFENLSLQAEDVVFCFYGALPGRCSSTQAPLPAGASRTSPRTDIRERDGGIADITTRERVEEVVGVILKLLAF